MITVIQIIFRILSLVVIVDIFLSFILPPFHPIRSFLDKIVDPMLNPIRKIVPPLGGFDFSPVVLILIIQLIEYLVIRLLI